MKVEKRSPKKQIHPGVTLLAETVAGAKSSEDKVKVLVATLEKDGDDFHEAEKDATMRKGAILTRVYLFRKGLESDPQLLERMKEQLRNQITSAVAETSEKQLREDERQNFDTLVFRACFKLPRTTSWRYTKLVEYLEGTSEDPGLWGQRIMRDGGVLQCVAAAMKPKQVISTENAEDDLFDEESPPSNGDDDDNNDKDDLSDDDEFGGEEDGPALSDAAAKAFDRRIEGYYITATVWHLSEGLLEAVAVTGEKEACSPILKAIANESMIQWYGIDPADLPLRTFDKLKKAEQQGFGVLGAREGHSASK